MNLHPSTDRPPGYSISSANELTGNGQRTSKSNPPCPLAVDRYINLTATSPKPPVRPLNIKPNPSDAQDFHVDTRSSLQTSLTTNTNTITQFERNRSLILLPHGRRVTVEHCPASSSHYQHITPNETSISSRTSCILERGDYSRLPHSQVSQNILCTS